MIGCDGFGKMKSRLAQNFNTRKPLICSGCDCQCGNMLAQVGECIVRKGIRANEKKTKPATSKLLVLKHHLQVINIQLGDDNTPVQAGLPSLTSKLSHVCQESLARREPYLESGEIQWARFVVEDLVWETACLLLIRTKMTSGSFPCWTSKARWRCCCM